METSVDKCLAFCQSLAMSGQKFSFTLSIGKDNFSFNNKELGSSSCVKKKKKSPSQVRREQRRKEERSLKKTAEAAEKVADFQCSQCDSSFKAEEDLNAHIGEVHTVVDQVEQAASSFNCDQCEYTNVSEKGLRQHKRMKHGKAQLSASSSPSSPESLRQPESYSSVASKSLSLPSLSDTEDREEDLRFEEEVRFHKENPNTCEFCRKKCDGNIDMMENCVATGGRHSIPLY